MHRIRTVVTGVPGSPYYLTAYFSSESPVNAAASAWAQFTGALQTAANCPQGVTITLEGQVLEVDPATGDVVGSLSVSPQTVTGTRTATMVPPQANAVYTLRTGVYAGGREIRGRYHRPLVENTNVQSSPAGAGSLTSTTQTGWQNEVNTLIAASGVDWVVWAKSQGRWEPVSAATLKTQLGTLRSRAAFP